MGRAMSHSKESKEKYREEPEAEPIEAAGVAEDVPQQGEKGSAGAETDVSEMESLKKDVEALKGENSELKDQYLRKSADFENYRKRMAKEKQDAVKYGNQELLKDLLEVIDNFERAIKSSSASQDFEAFRDGISMTEQHFTQLLATRWGLKKVETVEVEFNPELHEALYQEPREGLSTTTVLEILQTGYILHDRVLRPAKVKVGVPPS
jgi:molecular chaperone GrpE